MSDKEDYETLVGEVRKIDQDAADYMVSNECANLKCFVFHQGLGGAFAWGF